MSKIHILIVGVFTFFLLIELQRHLKVQLLHSIFTTCAKSRQSIGQHFPDQLIEISIFCIFPYWLRFELWGAGHVSNYRDIELQ
jgi:hypothetical protein